MGTSRRKRSDVAVMLRATALLLGVCGVASEAVDLTPDNFDKEVLNSGKSAFIKFLAPW